MINYSNQRREKKMMWVFNQNNNEKNKQKTKQAENEVLHKQIKRRCNRITHCVLPQNEKE